MESHGAMPCAHCPHHMGRNLPCKDMAHCPGMLDCSGFVGLALQAGTHLVRSHVTTSEWASYSPGPGITRQPDHPPPIG